jgi:hypothetical protein
MNKNAEEQFTMSNNNMNQASFEEGKPRIEVNIVSKIKQSNDLEIVQLFTSSIEFISSHIEEDKEQERNEREMLDQFSKVFVEGG